MTDDSPYPTDRALELAIREVAHRFGPDEPIAELAIREWVFNSLMVVDDAEQQIEQEYNPF